MKFLIYIYIIISLPLSGQIIERFNKSNDIFRNENLKSNVDFKKIMLCCLNGIIIPDHSERIIRISEISSWGSESYLILISKKNEVTDLFQSYIQNFNEDGDVFHAILTRKFSLEKDEGRELFMDIKWESFEGLVKKIENEKIMGESGDDFAFYIIESIDKSGDYKGLFFPVSFHKQVGQITKKITDTIKLLKESPR